MSVKIVFRGCIGAILLLVVFSLASQQRVNADIGWPPMYPSGSSVGVTPGEENMVRMISEEVNLVVEEHEGTPPVDLGDSPAAWMRAQVDAEFLMRNLGQEQQSFDVWFSLAASVHYEGLLAYQPENTLQGFQVWVDGQPAAFETVKAPDVGDPQTESAWARFPMTFPPGEDVVVRVSYTIYPSGRRPFGSFEYILQTGAGWYDTIGQADVRVTLPDPVTPENVSLAGRSVEGLPIAPQPAGFVIDGNTISWHFTNLEPTGQDNIFVDVLEPGAYHALLRARQQAASDPTSVDAQLDLAKAVENAVMIVKKIGQHGTGAELVVQANDAYRKALELDPNRAEIYTWYANWLMRTDGWLSLMRFGVCPEELCNVVSRGLALFPNDDDLLKIDKDIRILQQEAILYVTQEGLGSTMTAAAASFSATQDTLSTERASVMALVPTLTPVPLTATVTLQATDTPTLIPPAPTTAVAPGEGTITPGEKVSTPGTWYLLGGLVVLVIGLWGGWRWRQGRRLD